MTTLGTLEKIDDIRLAWRGEATDFTPWLAEAENLSALADALGFGKDGFEFVAKEVNVGPFRADILARDLTSAEGDLVLIENQFGKSDHDHLGKLITYASGLKAKTIVLIGEEIREEHRSAMNWLNQISDDHHQFFAVSLELWRIGASLPAPKFEVIVRPNDWERRVHAPAISAFGDMTDLRADYLRYWEVLAERLRELESGIRPRKPAAKNWMDYSLGVTGICVRLELSGQKSRIKAGLYLNGIHSKEQFAHLQSDLPSIEIEYGGALDWDPLPNKQAARIGLSLEGANPTNETDWPRQHRWLADQLVAFNRTFRSRISRLRVEDSQ